MIKVRRLFPSFALTAMAVLFVVGDRSPRAQSPLQPAGWALWSPYWTTEDGFTSTLLMKNNRGQETLRLTVALYFMDGSEYELAPIELGPRQTTALNLNRIVESLPPHLVTSREGGAEVRFGARNNAGIMGSIAVSNPEQGIAWNFRLYPVNPTLSVAPVRGVFWLRDEATDGFVAAQNASEEFITITPRFDINGTKHHLPPSQLTPGQTLKLELRNSLRTLGLEDATAGGLEFVYDGPPDAVKAHGVTFDRKGFSAEFDFLRYAAWEEEQTVDLKTPRFAIGVADPTLGLPGRQMFEPTLVLHNFNRHELAVNLAFGYREGSGARETRVPVSLAAGETRLLSVLDVLGDSIPPEAHWASLEISYTDRHTGLGAALVSVTQEGEHSIRSVLNWVHGSASEGWYWQADGDHNTLIGILNTDTEEARVAVSLDYYVDGERRSYELPERVVPARASELINVGEILAANVADRDGDQIPPQVTVGGYRVDKVGRRINRTLITETLVFNRRTKNYLTFYNTCCAFEDVSLSPGALTGIPGGGGQLNVEAFDFCSGNRRIVNESAFFSSNNTSVATVGSNTGAVSMISPGSTAVDAELEYFQMEFFVDPCIQAVFEAATDTTVIQVDVIEADIVNDRITVSLSPVSASGSLLVRAEGPGVSSTLFNGAKDGGQHTFSFARESLNIGQYTTVQASWTVSGVTHAASKSVAFFVLGQYRHSQYNTPNESACTGVPEQAYITNPNCVFNAVNLRGDFISQSWLNGSGITIDFGPEQNEAFCISNAPHPDDASGRSFRPQSIVPSCGATFSVNNLTVARGDDAPLSCGDQVLIVGLGGGVQGTTKTVTDRCPACTGRLQLDNYTTQPACRPGTISDLGNFTTIRLR